MGNEWFNLATHSPCGPAGEQKDGFRSELTCGKLARKDAYPERGFSAHSFLVRQRSAAIMR